MAPTAADPRVLLDEANAAIKAIEQKVASPPLVPDNKFLSEADGKILFCLEDGDLQGLRTWKGRGLFGDRTLNYSSTDLRKAAEKKYGGAEGFEQRRSEFQKSLEEGKLAEAYAKKAAAQRDIDQPTRRARLPKKTSASATAEDTRLPKPKKARKEALIKVARGLALFDGDEHWIVIKREARRFDDDEPLLDGAYYAKSVATVNFRDLDRSCEWSGMPEIQEWALAARKKAGEYDSEASDY